MELQFQVQRKITVKKESSTNPKLKVDDSVDSLIKYGIINIDKFSGPTSHQVTDYVKKVLNLKKAGHSGTLDPHVTGCLPIALERATRIVEYLLHAGKEYVALMHLHKEIDEKKIKAVFKKFTGKIKQLPPVKSSVKRQKRFSTIY